MEVALSTRDFFLHLPLLNWPIYRQVSSEGERVKLWKASMTLWFGQMDFVHAFSAWIHSLVSFWPHPIRTLTDPSVIASGPGHKVQGMLKDRNRKQKRA